ncbi:exodeoxyribonuclease V subunit beta [Aliiglaciecola sp. CAU 1673]|uniref:exodeoxyribonuclease V subunit beta n=1 Tax=Aliiglaciecola sp. CAU 1673 TaxID=3032595 RepID=UPI0023DB18AB|nr:exodeoxyribonuclease V subunit beta [Aliiglaciecola sp. CAU 1673]MDF2179814.1 exodeoxyribonuclease V subunit beta [Aliiglaciecola sp. CAU 1673]
MKSLDIGRFPLNGQALIEASAGTGKTFTIVRLYLRLLLGHGCAPLTVDRILVVTFTNAATAELKSRIRELIQQAAMDFYLGASQDPLIQTLIDELPDRTEACQRLFLALRQMDEASVFTIHGFSQRMLTQHAFESGAAYQQSLILDESAFLQQAVNDYWRRHVQTQSATLLQLTLAQWAEPGALLRHIRGLLNRDAKSPPLKKAPHDLLQDYQLAVTQLKRWWLDENIADTLNNAALRGNTLLGKGELVAAMQAFCQSGDLTFSFAEKHGWDAFFPEKIEKARTKKSPQMAHLDFARFEQVLALQQSLEQGLLLHHSHESLIKVKAALGKAKGLHHELSPDDLLVNLSRALGGEHGEALISAIRQQYPAAMIDEFQDTDPIQFDIFGRIYAPAGNECLIMIGDPKQAIYAFRGADIFTYIKAKRQVPEAQRFTLDKNWRSQPTMVKAVNSLFKQSVRGFLFNQDIPFSAVEPGRKPEPLMVDGKPLVGLAFHHLQGEGPQPFSQVQSLLARHCAMQIAALVKAGAQGQARLKDRALVPGDCAVLVRDRNEAALIKEALAELNIASVFLVRRSVFDTEIAADLLLLLQALHSPADEQAVKAAMLSAMVGLSGEDFDTWLKDDNRWQQLLWQFAQWHRIWQTQGIAAALYQVSTSLNLFESVLGSGSGSGSGGDGLRRVTDLRHLIELLQQQGAELEGESQLLRWYQQQVQAPDPNHEGQQLRLETDAQLVQIITMHACKGLEYPLVFVPFATRVNEQLDPIYHDEQHQLWVDFLAGEQALKKARQERLAEDIRLFYVALTRSVHYCSLGVWDPAARYGKGSLLGLSALGSLLTKEGDEIIPLAERLQALAQEPGITYLPIVASAPVPLAPVADSETVQLTNARLSRSVRQSWRLTSYSAISLAQDHLPAPGQDEGRDIELPVDTPQVRLDRFGFIRGAKAGTFLHGVLEQWVEEGKAGDFALLVAEQGQKYGIDESWWPVVSLWLEEVVQTPLFDSRALTLSQLGRTKVELEFHLPLARVSAGAFNRLVEKHLPGYGARYDFDNLNGMLKGFIDLVFEADGKVYVADYKSNHLGNNFSDYQQAALEQAMVAHDYRLQAILYCLALHRFLSVRRADYDYDKDMGGACYWFIRGMHPAHPGCGILTIRPPKALILALDALFNGESPKATEMEQLSLC